LPSYSSVASLIALDNIAEFSSHKKKINFL
jgi:hypothetical protein